MCMGVYGCIWMYICICTMEDIGMCIWIWSYDCDSFILIILLQHNAKTSGTKQTSKKHIHILILILLKMKFVFANTHTHIYIRIHIYNIYDPQRAKRIRKSKTIWADWKRFVWWSTQQPGNSKDFVISNSAQMKMLKEFWTSLKALSSMGITWKLPFLTLLTRYM